MNKLKLIVRALTLSALIIPILFFATGCTDNESLSPAEYSRIVQDFTVPHDTNRVWCYYYWIGDDISKEGVSKDLEAMKRFGIGAVLVGNINPDEVDGPVPLFSDLWWEIMVHTVEEGHRLGIDVGFFNCPGWSQSGGPWVTYDKAMRHLVYSETKVSGKGKYKLEKPADEFQDTRVLAFRTPVAESQRMNPQNTSIKVSPATDAPQKWLDGDLVSAPLFDIRKQQSYTIDFKTNGAIKANSLVLHPGSLPFRCNCEILAWQDGEYKSIRTFVFDRSNMGVNVGPLPNSPVAVSLPGVVSDTFRLVCSDLAGRQEKAGFSEIVISEAAVLERYIEKSLGKMHPTPLPAFDSYLWEPQYALDNNDLIVSEVIDISDKMDRDGNLVWEAPDGEWIVLRMGMTPTGTMNSPAAPQGKGYEIDKANAALTKFHFEQYIGEILKRVPPEKRSAFKYVIADSYEMGSQNWTDGFEERFKEVYGYDPLKYLPVFSGRIVGSIEESDRFLWDLRRLKADAIAYDYVGGLREISNENNLKTWLENYGHWGFPGEFLMYGGQSDLVSGEFWNEGELGNIECKSASSAAHIYGKPVTSAEAFTASGQDFRRHPAMLKKRGDWSFTEGINHMVLHVYIHQPDDIRIPGINAWFSTEFNRHNTWFEQGSAWTDYLRRCQHMLQQGKYVADVCYFIGEDVPKMTGSRDPEIPDGYSYDYINAEVILNRLSVKDGRLVLPDGMSYGLMVLPRLKTMRPEVLQKIEELVNQGAVILGSPPDHSPSLRDYPAADKTVTQVAARLWNEPSVDGRMKAKIGDGYILEGYTIQEALDLTGIQKDVEIPQEVPVLWTHRSLPGMEIYFLTNQSEETQTFSPTFRVTGLQPLLWDAVTGKIRKLSDYTQGHGRTVVPLKMEGFQSWFLVFTSQDHPAVSNGYLRNFPDYEEVLPIGSVWSADFLNKAIGPREEMEMPVLSDWSVSENKLINYYSGTAVYTTDFQILALQKGKEYFIDLGNVGVMANVILNGANLGNVWMHPFVLSANGHLKEGNNTLKVEVVNTWANRLIGEKNLPDDERRTWLKLDNFRAWQPLTPSGLLGPVSVRSLPLN
jgi:hypothetical protein